MFACSPGKVAQQWKESRMQGPIRADERFLITINQSGWLVDCVCEPTEGDPFHLA